MKGKQQKIFKLAQNANNKIIEILGLKKCQM
jgi:hypothetical protein